MGLQWRAGEATSGAAGRVEESLIKGLKAGIGVLGVPLHQCVRAGLEAFCRWKGSGWAGSWVGVGQWCWWRGAVEELLCGLGLPRADRG